MSVVTHVNFNQTSMAHLHLVYAFLFHSKLLADCPPLKLLIAFLDHWQMVTICSVQYKSDIMEVQFR